MIELIVNRCVSCSLPTKSVTVSTNFSKPRRGLKLTLDGGSNSLLLEALDILGRQLAAEKGIFGERLKVPPTKRVSVQANCGGEENVGRPSSNLVRKVLANLVKDVFIPCCRQRNTTGEKGRLVSMVSTVGGHWEPSAKSSPSCPRRRYRHEHRLVRRLS
jgi:hypothetical protein